MLLLVVLLELKDPVTPVGSPVALKATSPVNPFTPTTSTASVVLELMVARVGALVEAERWKPGTGMVTRIVAVFVAVSETPVTVTV